MSDSNSIKISGEPTVDPQVCKFIVNKEILSSGTFTCRDNVMAKGSPLLEKLFELEGITQVMVSGSTLTIAKSSDEEWPSLGQKIGTIIRGLFADGTTLVDPDVLKKSPSEESMRLRIQKLFNESINPQISSHGGWVELVDVEGTVVHLRLGGGCQGCASANQTLKLGIEKAIREAVPEVTDVLDATDHASGISPYYS